MTTLLAARPFDWTRVIAAVSLVWVALNWFTGTRRSIRIIFGLDVKQYRNAVLPANLLQAQRDYFGAHTYERLDKPRGEFFHTNWTGKGGTTASTTYNV